jgi:circadian clock protein KaiC
LFISLAETEARIRRIGQALGLDLSKVDFLDLSQGPQFFAEVQSYDIFSPAEVERQPTTERIVRTVEQIRPKRVFVDPMTQLRYLATHAFQYRQQVLSFLRFLVEHGATVMFTSEASMEAPDADLQFISDGIIELGLDDCSRYVSVTKMRWSAFSPGRHAMNLTDRKMVVFPRLVPQEHGRTFVHEPISSGVHRLISSSMVVWKGARSLLSQDHLVSARPHLGCFSCKRP